MKFKMRLFIVSCVLMFGLFQQSVFAMHIAEGFLPPVWCVSWGLITLPFFIGGLISIKRLICQEPKIKLILSMAGAFAFVLSALKIPSVTGSCSHPTGVGFGAILFGPLVMTVLGVVVLLFQALLLAHGGLTTLGANAFAMAVVGPFVSFFTYKILKKTKVSSDFAIFFSAALGNMLTYITTAFQLAIAIPAQTGGFVVSFEKFLGVFALTQIPIAISEGILTVLIYNAIIKQDKDLPNRIAILCGRTKV